MTLTIFKNAILIDPELKTEIKGDLLIEKDKIKDVGIQVNTPTNLLRIINCEGKHLAPGIIDIGVKVCEPGERHKESFKSAGQAAAAGDGGP